MAATLASWRNKTASELREIGDKSLILSPILVFEHELSRICTNMAKDERKNVHRYMEVYDAMKKAVPDDNNMLEVMRACEFIIADCIAQSNVGKDIEEQTYKAIADDIRRFTEAFKPIAEEVMED